MFLEISQKSQENICARVSFLIKLQTWDLQFYLKKGSGTGVFLWKFAKFLRDLFLLNTSSGCFWNYKELVNEHFPNTLELSTNQEKKPILQDGCPMQKSKQVQMTYSEIGRKIFSIQARSPDLNPIENVFNLLR